MPNNALTAECPVLDAWEAINDDSLEDHTFTRTVLEHVTELPAYGGTAVRSVKGWTLEALQTLCKRRCPRLFMDYEADLAARQEHGTRRGWIQIYSVHRHRVAQAVHRHSRAVEIQDTDDASTRRKANQIKVLSQLDKDMKCGDFYGSAAKYVKFILQFQETQEMDETVLYQQVSSHQRLSATVQARWAATNPARFPRELEPFLRWIFTEYVKERA